MHTDKKRKYHTCHSLTEASIGPRGRPRSTMCILFVHRKPEAASGSYRFILASNRDEMLDRPTASAHFWKQHPECLGGIDMEPGKEGGTWLAMSKRGRLAALLNLTGEKRSSQTSGKGRGFLVADFVSSEEPPVDYLNRLHVENQANQPYNPYNLVLVDLGKADVHFLNSAENSKGPGHICCEEILGFGNSAIERPFRKVEAGKEAFREIVQDATVAQQEVLIKDLLKFLKWKESHLPDPELQERAPDRYKELSSIFVDVEGVYGTRTHSVILVDGQNNVTFVEDTLMPDGSWKYQTFNFPLESSV